MNSERRGTYVVWLFPNTLDTLTICIYLFLILLWHTMNQIMCAASSRSFLLRVFGHFCCFAVVVLLLLLSLEPFLGCDWLFNCSVVQCEQCMWWLWADLDCLQWYIYTSRGSPPSVSFHCYGAPKKMTFPRWHWWHFHTNNVRAMHGSPYTFSVKLKWQTVNFWVFRCMLLDWSVFAHVTPSRTLYGRGSKALWRFCGN